MSGRPKSGCDSRSWSGWEFFPHDVQADCTQPGMDEGPWRSSEDAEAFRNIQVDRRSVCLNNGIELNSSEARISRPFDHVLHQRPTNSVATSSLGDQETPRGNMGTLGRAIGIHVCSAQYGTVLAIGDYHPTRVRRHPVLTCFEFRRRTVHRHSFAGCGHFSYYLPHSGPVVVTCRLNSAVLRHRGILSIERHHIGWWDNELVKCPGRVVAI